MSTALLPAIPATMTLVNVGSSAVAVACVDARRVQRATRRRAPKRRPSRPRPPEEARQGNEIAPRGRDEADAAAISSIDALVREGLAASIRPSRCAAHEEVAAELQRAGRRPVCRCGTTIWPGGDGPCRMTAGRAAFAMPASSAPRRPAPSPLLAIPTRARTLTRAWARRLRVRRMKCARADRQPVLDPATRSPESQRAAHRPRGSPAGVRPHR